MSEESTSYPFGTEVWAKVVNRYWWPGIVVDPATVPTDLLEFVNNVNHIAVVRFETEQLYEVVISKHKICQYSCDLKMEYVKRGLSLYKNQKKGIKVIGNFEMETFKKDVVSMENRIGGDPNIFLNLEEEQVKMKTIVKQLFTPGNNKKPKKKEARRKSTPAPIIPKMPQPKQSKPPITKQRASTQSKNVKLSSPIKTQKSKPFPVSQQRTSFRSKVVKRASPTQTTPLTNNFSCYSENGCKFITNRYDILRRHMALHKNDTSVEKVEKIPNKRKNVKTRASNTKKIKIDVLLKDWDEDGEDDTIKSTSEGVQSTSEAEQSTNEAVQSTTEVVEPISGVVQSTTEVVQSKSTNEVVQSVNEVVQSVNEVVQSVNEVSQSASEVALIQNKIEETLTSSPIKVFEFNENDIDTPVIELRQNKSECSSTVDDLSELYESQLTSVSIKSTIIDASPKESILANKTDEIDDQPENTNLFLEKTIKTLDQKDNFEITLCSIGSSLNTSDANILTKNNNGVSEPELKKPNSPNKDIHLKTDTVDILAEKMASYTEEPAIFEQTTIDTEILSNDAEINQSSGTTIDKDIPLENSCSVDSISRKIDSEDETSKEKDLLTCMIDNPVPHCMNQDGWELHPHNGHKEANSYSAELKLSTSHDWYTA